MISYQKAVVISAFLAFFIFSGCIFDSKPVTTVRTEGLTLAFDTSYLPEEVKANTPFDIFMSLTNAGSYSIKPGELTIKLFGGSYSSSGQPWTNPELIRGADTTEEFGDFLSIDEFKDATFTGVTVAGTEVPFTVGASMCYVYKTNANASICLKGENDPAPFCTDNDDKLKVISVAPVTVTGITQQSYVGSVDVLITVANKGSGKVYDLKDPDCSDKRNEDIVTLESFKMQGVDPKEITCDKTVRLSEFTETSFKCTVEDLPPATVEKSAEVVISYKYSSSITKTLYASA